MSSAEVTEYISKQIAPKSETLQQVRELLLEIEPRLEEAIAWNSPQFKFNGKYIVGLCAFKNHLTFSPQSAQVMQSHEKQLEGYVVSKNSFQFAVDQAPPRELIESLVRSRMSEVG